MKTKRSLHYALLLVLVTLTCLIGTPQPSRADTISDLADILDKVGSIPGVPVDGQMIRDSRDLFTCIDNANDDVAVAKCLDTQKEKTNSIASTFGADIPSWFYDLIDLYIDVREGDFWGIIAKLGEAVICAVAQVIASGYDVCGLVEYLVDLGKGLYDEGKAFVEFLSDVGEAVVDGFNAAGCALGIGGCPDAPQPTRAETVQNYYASYYAGRLQDGLKAREAVDPSAFDSLRKQIETPHINNTYSYWKAIPGMTESQIKFYVDNERSLLDEAFKRFSDEVDKRWTADLAMNVLSELSRQRSLYEEHDTQKMRISNLARQALDKFKQSKTNPRDTVVSICTDYFKKTRGFEHVDRWLVTPHSDDSAKKLSPSVISNGKWCEGYWNKNRNEFSPYFRDYVKTKCPESSGKLACPSKDDYRMCDTLLNSITGTGPSTPTASAGKNMGDLTGSENDWCRGPGKTVTPVAKKAEEPAKAIKKEEPPKDTKQVEPAKVARKEEPAKAVKKEEPPKDTKQVEPTKVARKEEPAKAVKKEEPPKDTKQVEPTKVARKDVTASGPSSANTSAADLTSGNSVTMAGKTAQWGGTMTVDAAQAAAKNLNNSGFCNFDIRHTVRNTGGAASGSFRSLWTNSAVSGSWPHAWQSVDAGKEKTESDNLPLKPGSNSLRLKVDDLSQVTESNEKNNEFLLTVNVTGNCGPEEVKKVVPSQVPPDVQRAPDVQRIPNAQPKFKK